MSWRCRICGVRFDAPVIRERKENLDGENGTIPALVWGLCKESE